jgi:lipase chaperone LimK
MAERIFSARFALHTDHDHLRLQNLHDLGYDDTERLANIKEDRKDYEDRWSSYKRPEKKKIDWYERVTEMEQCSNDRACDMIVEQGGTPFVP